MSRRLKLDMRNDCESVIAGVQHWYRPNNAATGQSVTLYERHPVSVMQIRSRLNHIPI